jgi:flagellar biosynthesis/type III secretory pathway M-ring protein FliF/YscJ
MITWIACLAIAIAVQVVLLFVLWLFVKALAEEQLADFADAEKHLDKTGELECEAAILRAQLGDLRNEIAALIDNGRKTRETYTAVMDNHVKRISYLEDRFAHVRGAFLDDVS